MSDNQERSNELPEIIDVDFLPILDDEDYKREKTGKAQELDQTLVDTNMFTDSQAQTVDKELNQTDKTTDTQETIKEDFKENFKENVNPKEYIKQEGYKKGTEYSQANTYTNTQQTGGYTNYRQSEKNYSHNYTGSNNQNMRQDTSYASYDLARRQEFRKKKKKFGASILSGIGIVLAIFIGLPIALGLGGTAVFIIGMGIFLSIMALGVGVLGLGMAGFTAAAGMGPMGVLFLFGSLVALGVGGLGSCIICLIFIGIKNLIIGISRRRKIRKESQEV